MIDTHLLPEEKLKEYNQMLRDVFYTKADDFDQSGRNICKLCFPLVSIQQKAGSGLSALVRHVKAHHENHREVCRFTFDGV